MEYILVGYDGSAAGERALRWAVRECRLRGLPLRLCHSWLWPYASAPAGPSLEAMRRTAERVLDKGAYIAESMAPRLEVRTVLHRGTAVSCLLDESADAAMVVVGAGDRSESSEPHMGSTAAAVVGHTFGPVVVVRESMPGGRIVVGVDGSATSDAALAFAFEEAVLHRLDLTAVHAAETPAGGPQEEQSRAAGALLQRTVAAWCTKYPHVHTRTLLTSEPPQDALLSASQGAALLVVGDHTEVHGAAEPLGAVSRMVLRSAGCPVAIVHPVRL